MNILSGRPRLIAAGVAVLLLGVVAVVLVVRSGEDEADSRLARAMALAPETALRFNWTDWAAVRSELDSGVSASSELREVRRFLDAGYDADLTSTSVLVQSTDALHEHFGISPASLDWELYTSGEEAALLLMGLSDDTDLDELEESLEEVGYERPDDEDGVWRGDPDRLFELGTVTFELANLRLDRDRRILLGSDLPAPLERWEEEQRGTTDDGVGEVVAPVQEAVSASIYASEWVCTQLSMNDASPEDQRRAAELIEEAGEIHPLRGFAMAELAGGDVRVAMSFENEEQARTNADTRSVLAAGPAVGQGGDFSERFSLGPVEADGSVVTMELEPAPYAFVLSDLANGPLLFAAC